MQTQSKTFAIIALISGILALLIFCIPVVALFLAVIGTIFGIIAVAGSSRTNEPAGLHISSLIISVLALIIAIIYNYYIFNKSEFKNFNNINNNNLNNNYNTPDSSIYDINSDLIDTNFTDFDSAMMDKNQLNNLDNKNTDKSNGPGTPPK